MKKTILIALLAFGASAWALDTEAGLGLAEGTPAHHDGISDIGNVKDALVAANDDAKLSQLDLSSHSGDKVALDLEIKTIFRSGTSGTVTLKGVSGEFASAIRTSPGAVKTVTILPAGSSK